MHDRIEPIFSPAFFLLPDASVDLHKWSVIACDQHTSEKEYWEEVKQIVANFPSTLNITLPEVKLKKDNSKEVNLIHNTMLEYDKNILKNKLDNGFIYVQRTMHNGAIREGLVGCVDLEQYSYIKDKYAQIRPTEDTVQKRIPPRLQVRKGATLETSHILMLLDDPSCEIIEPLQAIKNEKTALYDVDLMLEGGNIKGWLINDEALISSIQEKIALLGNAKRFHSLYEGTNKATPFTLAVGDGNHSLATAKAYWEELKPTLTKKQIKQHPARYCMVELENIRSNAIEIEPIHRIMYYANFEYVWTELQLFVAQSGAILLDTIQDKNNPVFKIVHNNQILAFSVANFKWTVPAEMLESFFEYYQEKNPAIEIDYIHGEDTIMKLAQEDAVGFILPEIDKGDIFRGVAIGGTLPKKTFSMGMSNEKRYYMECHKIVE